MSKLLKKQTELFLVKGKVPLWKEMFSCQMHCVMFKKMNSFVFNRMNCFMFKRISFCQKKCFLAKGNAFLFKEMLSCPKKRILSKEKISFQMKKFLSKEKNPGKGNDFLSNKRIIRENIFCWLNRFLFKEMHFKNVMVGKFCLSSLALGPVLKSN